MTTVARPRLHHLAPLVLGLWGVFVAGTARASNESWGSLGASHWTDGSVFALTMWNGQLIAGGDFDLAGGTPARNLARWDGQSWHALGLGVGPGNSPHRVVTMTVFEGDLVVGGAFLGAGGDPSINHLARWDGQAWTGMGAALAFSQDVHALSVFQGELIVAGDFNSIGARPAARIARYGGSWRPMGQGFDQAPRALLEYEGHLIAGGPFVVADGLPRPTIARWVEDGRWEPMGEGFQARPDRTARVLILTFYGDDLYAAGHFIRSGSNTAQGIARWDGEAWVGLNSGVTSDDGQFWVRSMTEYRGELYLGGYFDEAGGVRVNDLARFDGSGWSGLGAGVNDLVRAMLVRDEKLFIAGDFDQAGGLSAHFLSTWQSRSVSIGGGEIVPPPAEPLPTAVTLLPNRPNPFNPATTIRFSLAEPGPVVLRVVDLRGALVRTLEDRVLPAGHHQARWDGLDAVGAAAASGVYLVHLDAGNRRRTEKVTLLR